MMIRSFIRSYAIFSACVAISVALITYFMFESKADYGIIMNVGVYFILTLSSSLFMLSRIQVEPSRFQQLILLNFFVKLLLAIIYFIAVYNIFNDSLIIFVLSFFSAFIIFTIFEVSFLLRRLKGKGENKSD